MGKYTKSSQIRDPKFAKFSNSRFLLLLLSSKFAVKNSQIREFLLIKNATWPFTVKVKPILLYINNQTDWMKEATLLILPKHYTKYNLM